MSLQDYHLILIVKHQFHSSFEACEYKRTLVKYAWLDHF